MSKVSLPLLFLPCAKDIVVVISRERTVLAEQWILRSRTAHLRTSSSFSRALSPTTSQQRAGLYMEHSTAGRQYTTTPYLSLAVTFPAMKHKSAVQYHGGPPPPAGMAQSFLQSPRRACAPLSFPTVCFVKTFAFFHGAVAVTEVEMDMDVNNTFEDSINSALFLRNSIVRMNGFLKFSRGVAEVGAGIMLLQSRVVANNGTNVVFDRNVAMSIGGAIFSSVSSQ